ncbi:MAG: NTP transferase domain-containing protein, partial [Candidatus Aegiribacteria sp.]|nr:NTP transferase domain-containing protein [Candidatus Aegiribacteria sp.]
MEIEGVLFLAAGYGTRIEPLSLLRPKALLPFGNSTVLAELARRICALRPRRVRINASRCPEVLLNELISVWPIEMCSVYFEERPLGVCATLARHATAMTKGTWMIVNTDMIIEGFDAVKMMKFHKETESSWTVLTGCFPSEGSYSPLLMDENRCFGTG